MIVSPIIKQNYPKFSLGTNVDGTGGKTKEVLSNLRLIGVSQKMLAQPKRIVGIAMLFHVARDKSTTSGPLFPR